MLASEQTRLTAGNITNHDQQRETVKTADVANQIITAFSFFVLLSQFTSFFQRSTGFSIFSLTVFISVSFNDSLLLVFFNVFLLLHQIFFVTLYSILKCDNAKVTIKSVLSVQTFKNIS